MDELEIMAEIVALKSLLRDTDYQALKFAEGALTESEYAETRAKRAAWRARINELEAELASEVEVTDGD